MNGKMRVDRTILHNGNVLVSKPWGQYIDIYRSDTVVFKKIDISPGEEISYQYHHDRDEFWYISSGHGVLIIDDDQREVLAGDCVIIRKEVKHQIKNTGNLALTFFEMQCGHCEEDDIVRISDKYER